MDSTSIQDYLKAIYNINERGVPARTKDLADRLHVSAPSVTEMIKRLSEMGLVDYEAYRGAFLTTRGLIEARKVVRKHRLIERFLHDILGVARGRVHSEACRLEHSVSDEVADAMCRKMNAPDLCPDDDRPIPPCVLDVAECSDCESAHPSEGNGRVLTQLSNLRTGDEATVVRVRGGTARTKRLLDMGLTPGTPIRVVGAAPFKGPVQVSVRGTSVAIGRGMAESVLVMIDKGVGNKIAPDRHAAE
ncbi:MAG: metal-dependent transcriptional regulator [Candidatus Thorarchaeota archaeon]